MAERSEARLARVRTEANQHRRVLQIARQLSATLGSDFFQSLVTHLANTFQADCVFLGELAGTPTDRIRTLAVFRGQEASENFEQRLAGTATAQALCDGSLVCSRDVRRLFPLDDLIEAMDAEGYIGVRLSDSSSEPVGVVAMLSKHGFENSQAAKSVLDAFVPRAAAEL